MKVPVRCVPTETGGVRIETIAHVSGGSGRPLWINKLEIPEEQLHEFLRDFIKAADASPPTPLDGG